MSNHLPTSVALAVEDPKYASTGNLERALGFYSDEIHPDDLEMVAEEYGRRSGNYEYTSSEYVSEYL